MTSKKSGPNLKIGYPKGTCVGYNIATHFHNSFALTVLQLDRINMRSNQTISASLALLWVRY